MLINKIKEQKGSAYIESALVIMVFMWIIAIITAILPVFMHINRVNTYANHVARIISVEGGLTSSAESKIAEYRSKMGLDNVVLDYSDSDFFDGFKVQLNDEVVVETKTDYTFKIIGIPINIPINTRAISRSEVYYK